MTSSDRPFPWVGLITLAAAGFAWWQVDPFVLAGRDLDCLIEARRHAERINKIRQGDDNG